MPVVLRYHR